MNAVDPKRRRSSSSTSKPVAGHRSADLGVNGIAISKKRKADDEPLEDRRHVAGEVREDRASDAEGRDDLQRGQLALGGDIISVKTYEKNFTDQLDFLILAKLKPGVSAEQGRKAIEPLLKAYPTAKLKDNAQYKADQKKQVNQFLNLFYVLLFLAVIIAAIGITNTMTLSIHERTREDRTAAVGRREPASDEIDDPVGIGDHRVARHAARHGDRAVLRLVRRGGAARSGHHEVLPRHRSR